MESKKIFVIGMGAPGIGEGALLKELLKKHNISMKDIEIIDKFKDQEKVDADSLNSAITIVEEIPSKHIEVERRGKKGKYKKNWER